MLGRYIFFKLLFMTKIKYSIHDLISIKLTVYTNVKDFKN